MERINNLIIKIAKGHIFYENGEPLFNKPHYVNIKPTITMNQEELDEFFGMGISSWPEVGSRWMQRVILDRDFDDDGFLVVQPNVYRFKLETAPSIGVRSIIYEYLATSVFWGF